MAAGLAPIALPTSQGPARVHLFVPPGSPRALLVLGHGAGGGVAAPDLAALAGALPTGGIEVALVEQPYRVAGRRSPVAAPRLDAAWLEVLADLRRRPQLATVPLVVGGRSSGARVACRTAEAAGVAGMAGLARVAPVAGVVALAYPLRPPNGTIRLEELYGVTAPVLVVQGSRDPFGAAADFPRPLPAGLQLVEVPGADHGFRCRRTDLPTPADCIDGVVTAVRDWLSAATGPAIGRGPG